MLTTRLKTRLGLAFSSEMVSGAVTTHLAAAFGYNGGLVVPTGGSFEAFMINSISSKRISLPNRDLGVETLNTERTSSRSSSEPSAELDLND